MLSGSMPMEYRSFNNLRYLLMQRAQWVTGWARTIFLWQMVQKYLYDPRTK